MTAPILGFDTAAAHCAAAVLSGGIIVASAQESMAKGQAERLMDLCTEVLHQAGLDWRDLGGIGVGIGPGNFTGIRISVAAARGLGLALGVPAVGVSSLEAAACDVPRPVLAGVDARLGRVYHQLFVVDQSHPPEIGDPATPPAGLARPGLRCVGFANDLLSEALGAQAVAPVHPLAEAIARVAADRIAAGGAIARPAPLYLRPADAAPMRKAPPAILG